LIRCLFPFTLALAIAVTTPARAGDPTAPDTGAVLVRVLNADAVARTHSPMGYKIGSFLSMDMEKQVLEGIGTEVVAKLTASGLDSSTVEIVTRNTQPQGWMSCDLSSGTMSSANLAPGSYQLLRIQVKGMPRPVGPSDPVAPYLSRLLGSMNDYIAASIASELHEYGGEAVFKFTGGPRPGTGG
jgi:hypothetical protein